VCAGHEHTSFYENGALVCVRCGGQLISQNGDEIIVFQDTQSTRHTTPHAAHHKSEGILMRHCCAASNTTTSTKHKHRNRVVVTQGNRSEHG